MEKEQLSPNSNGYVDFDVTLESGSGIDKIDGNGYVDDRIRLVNNIFIYHLEKATL